MGCGRVHMHANLKCVCATKKYIILYRETVGHSADDVLYYLPAFFSTLI